ncbi:hypothetical protein WB280_005190 [Escherichia coli]|nr:hypothetical protein [Escherichia coli]ELG2796874.1 hypothetical protein [Escherichia coli]
MNKKNRPLQAANSDIRVSDVTPLTKSLQAPKRTPKKHRARVYMLRTGIEGWTENDILNKDVHNGKIPAPVKSGR